MPDQLVLIGLSPRQLFIIDEMLEMEIMEVDKGHSERDGVELTKLQQWISYHLSQASE